MLYGYLNSPFVSNHFSDAAIPPTSLTSPVVSGSGVVGQTLSTTDGTWSGTLPITFTYQWNRNGIIIVGATNNTYTLVTADASTSIDCTVTATNAGGSLSKNSNAISVAAAGDADANAFIAAAAITDTTQKAAIDKLVVDLKGYGIWTKMKALYPFVGGTAAQHKFNLKNPLDTDAAFRLVFNGGWTHSSTGALPNKTNAFADTKFVPSVSGLLNSSHFSYYSRTLGALGYAFGTTDAGQTNRTFFQLDNGSNYGAVFTIPSGYFNYFGATSLGLLTVNRTASNVTNMWEKNVKKATSANAAVALTNKPLYLAAQNVDGTAFSFFNGQLAFSSIGDGLTDTEAANYYTAVQTFQTTLNRQVGVPIVADADAQAFLNAAVITDTTQASAVNTLVTDLKGYGIWTKMKALYPFVGGTAAQHKFNLRSPLDTDAAFRLVFNGGWTHSSTGALPNGTNAYANSFFNPSTTLTNNNYHLSNYSRTQITSTNSVDIGCSESDGRMIALSQYYNVSHLKKVFLAGDYASTFLSANNTDTLGFQIGTRTSNILAKMFMDGVQTGNTYTGTNTNAFPIRNMYISAQNSGGLGIPYDYSPRQLAFSSIGDGLTDTEAANYYTAVQTFQTTLGRQV